DVARFRNHRSVRWNERYSQQADPHSRFDVRTISRRSASDLARSPICREIGFFDRKRNAQSDGRNEKIYRASFRRTDYAGIRKTAVRKSKPKSVEIDCGLRHSSLFAWPE